MKILFITDLYNIDNKDKTIPFIFEDFAKSFIDFNHKISVIRPSFIVNSLIRKHKIYPTRKYQKNNIEIFNRNFFLPFIFEKKDFIEHLKKQDFDLIISHMPSGHIYSNLINKTLKIPHIAIVHQSDYWVLSNFKYKFYFKKRLQKALNEANLIGARNQFLKEKLSANFILPSFVKKETILENKKTFQKNKLKIITLSKLIKRKKLDLAIIALFKVDFDFEYSIYGEGKEKQKLEKLIKKYNLQEKIKIYPQIEHKEIYKKLSENDVFLLPSINESFGISYLEALSQGLITIGVKNTGIDGIIKDNENGFLINPDVEEIKAVLEKIYNLDIKEKEEISKNSLILARNYEKEKIMKKYFENIKKIFDMECF